jgi:hypothetical protein
MAVVDPVPADEAVLQLRVVVAPEPGADAEETERLTRQLRSELRDLDVDDVALVSAGEVPLGAKGVDGAALGELLVTMSASGGVFATVVATVRAWLGSRTGARTVKLTIDGDTLELGGASDDERSVLVQAFVQSHRRA